MANCCPQGYTYNPVSGKCEQVSSSLAVYTGPSIPALKPTCPGYGHIGAVFYADITSIPKPVTASLNSVNFPNPVDFYNYAVLLDGASSPLGIQTAVSTTPANMTWGVPFPIPTPVPPLCTTGRFNLSSIFANSPNIGSGSWAGIEFCVTVPQTKTYYIGLSADDTLRLSLGNQLLIDIQGAGWNFSTWKVFPITLNAGVNVFFLEMLNSLSVLGSLAIGMEIYDATLSQLTTAPNATALAPYVLFNSSSLVGQLFTSYTDRNGIPAGYLCTNGCNLNVCNNPPTCDCVQSVDTSPCCYQLTNCVTGASVLTQTDLSLSVGKIVQIDSTGACFIVSLSGNFGCTGSAPVVIIKSFDTCDLCTKKCYTLLDCSAQNPDILVSNDLSAYIGKVIKISTCPDICWTVVDSDSCIGAVPIVLSSSFDSCQKCTGIFTPTLVLKSRSVYPNYGNTVNNCSIDYIEKVNCNYAEQAYSKVIKTRYGLKSCEEDQYDKWWVKKKLLDLNLLEDPTACCPPETPITCDVLPEPPLPVPIACPAPTNVTTAFSYIVDCLPVTNVVTNFTFNNPVGNP